MSKGASGGGEGRKKMLETAGKFFGWALDEWRAESRHN